MLRRRHSGLGEAYEEAGIVLISPAATNPRLTDRGLRYTFRTCGPDDVQGAMVSDWIAAEWPGADVAVVHDGRDLRSRRLLRRRSAGSTELGIGTWHRSSRSSRDKTEFSELLTTFETLGIDVVFYGGYPS